MKYPAHFTRQPNRIVKSPDRHMIDHYFDSIRGIATLQFTTMTAAVIGLVLLVVR